MDIQAIDAINQHWKQIFHTLKNTSRPILETLKLTKVDANILLALYNNQEKTKAELAEYLSFKPNSLTRSLDRLINSGSVQRVIDANDRRFIKLSLTIQGNKLAKEYIKQIRQPWLAILSSIDDNEIKTLQTILEKIVLTLPKLKLG